LLDRAIYHGIGLAPDPDIEDLYIETCSFPLTYDPDKDPAVADFSKNLNNLSADSVIQEPDSDISDSESESGNSSCSATSDLDNDDMQLEDNSTNKRLTIKLPARNLGTHPKPQDSTSRAKRQQKILSPVEKLHAIVVHILCTNKRRVRIKHLIVQFCEKQYHHLVPVRGMPIRWNTTYAEIDRGIKLRPVNISDSFSSTYSPC
jgi:hypothetical protein